MAPGEVEELMVELVYIYVRLWAKTFHTRHRGEYRAISYSIGSQSLTVCGRASRNMYEEPQDTGI